MAGKGKHTSLGDILSEKSIRGSVGRSMDMDDRPLDPNQSISNLSFATRAEPWELGRSASNSSFTPNLKLPLKAHPHGPR